MSDDELAAVLANTQGGWQTPDVSFANVTIEGALLVEDTAGQYVFIWNSPGEGPKIDLAPANYGPNVAPASLLATTVPNGGDPYDVLVIQSPNNTDVPVDHSSITLASGTPAAPANASIYLDAYSVVAEDSSRNAGTGTMAGFGDLGRGIVAVAIAVGDSGSFTTTEGLALTVPSRLWNAGRAFRIDVQGRYAPSVSSNGPIMRVRKTNLAGTALVTQGRIANTSAGEYAPPPAIYFTVPADVTAPLVLTIQADTGTVIQRGPRAIIISDVGLAVTLSGLPTLT